VTDGTSETRIAAQVKLDAGDLLRIRDAFGLGEVKHSVFLADGLMNRNWRLDTATGSYALKLLCDVPAETARRNAVVLAALASAGFPVCAPLLGRGGDALLQIGPRTYLLSPWAEGRHVGGPT
jgi:homoserine kinase type II